MTGTPVGAHPDKYKNFMTVLCSYIINKQRVWQQEELSYDMVYVRPVLYTVCPSHCLSCMLLPLPLLYALSVSYTKSSLDLIIMDGKMFHNYKHVLCYRTETT